MLLQTTHAPRSIPFERRLQALLDHLGIARAGDRHGLPAPVPGTPPVFGLATGPTDLPERPVVGLVKGYIDVHAGEALTLDRLADEANLSKYHLARLFHEAAGQTLWSYVVEARIRKAKALLRENRPLADVAYETGFSDQSHFTRAFKRHVGLTPGQFRRRFRRKRTHRKNVQDSRP